MWARLLILLLLASNHATAGETSSSMAVHASANYYFLDDESDYIQPTVFADRGRLHVEARYNYEDRETGSLWAGYNLTGGEAVTFEFTPMIGVALPWMHSLK